MMPAQSTPAQVHSEFTRIFGGSPRMYRAPGRINIIGEHLDYNGGFVLPSAVDLFTWAAAAPRDDAVLEVQLCNVGSRHRIALRDIRRDGSGDVAEYLKGVAWAMQREGLEPGGCNLVIGGNIPLGGGLSSSASLELLLAYLLSDLAHAQLERERMARLCHAAEAEFVGVQCGIMDQYAIALGASGHAMMLDCRSRDYQLYPLPQAARFLVTHSGVNRRLPAGGYNSRRDECTSALALLGQSMPGLSFLVELTLDQLETNRALLGDTLFRRCRHVVTENRRVRAACQAMQDDDLDLLGSLMNESHRSLRDDYAVSCPELDALVEIAGACGGVLGSRMMGGGFGGCTLSLVRLDAVSETVRQIRQEYGKVLGREPWMHVAGPAGPVSAVEQWHEQ
jgi:galactokinase